MPGSEPLKLGGSRREKGALVARTMGTISNFGNPLWVARLASSSAASSPILLAVIMDARRRAIAVPAAPPALAAAAARAAAEPKKQYFKNRHVCSQSRCAFSNFQSAMACLVSLGTCTILGVVTAVEWRG
jgi:hypothetical protein